MKTFYATAIALSVLLGLMWSMPSAQSELLPGERLLRHPERWSVTINDPAPSALRESPDEIKATILNSLRQTYSSAVDYKAFSILGVALFFSGIGWWREGNLAKRRAPGQSITCP